MLGTFGCGALDGGEVAFKLLAMTTGPIFDALRQRVPDLERREPVAHARDKRRRARSFHDQAARRGGAGRSSRRLAQSTAQSRSASASTPAGSCRPSPVELSAPTGGRLQDALAGGDRPVKLIASTGDCRRWSARLRARFHHEVEVPAGSAARLMISASAHRAGTSSAGLNTTLLP
jgi:hypothetical protein